VFTRGFRVLRHSSHALKMVVETRWLQITLSPATDALNLKFELGLTTTEMYGVVPRGCSGRGYAVPAGID